VNGAREYGRFDVEADGRLSGHKVFVSAQRRDGKYPATHVFGNGVRIRKLYSAEQLAVELAKVDAQTPSR